MRYSVVLFDLDGTLLDTLDDLWDAVNFALSNQGLPMRTRDEVRNFIGNGILKLMERAVGSVSAPNVDMDAVMSDFKHFYGAHCEDKTAPYDGVLPLLKELRARGVRIGIVSNKADFAVQKLSKSYFGGLVDVAIGENEVSGIRKKPAPDTLIAAIEAIEALNRSENEKACCKDVCSLAQRGVKGSLVDPEGIGKIASKNVVYVGDSEVDIQTAKNAGVDCFSVTWGMKDRVFLIENGASVLVDTVEELFAALQK